MVREEEWGVNQFWLTENTHLFISNNLLVNVMVDEIGDVVVAILKNKVRKSAGEKMRQIAIDRNEGHDRPRQREK